jgi:hypothetical protein
MKRIIVSKGGNENEMKALRNENEINTSCLEQHSLGRKLVVHGRRWG